MPSRKPTPAPIALLRLPIAARGFATGVHGVPRLKSGRVSLQPVRFKQLSPGLAPCLLFRVLDDIVCTLAAKLICAFEE